MLLEPGFIVEALADGTVGFEAPGRDGRSLVGIGASCDSLGGLVADVVGLEVAADVVVGLAAGEELPGTLVSATVSTASSSPQDATTHKHEHTLAKTV